MASETIISPSGASVSGRITPAVFPFYTTGEDNLRVVSFNSAAGVKLRLVARLLGRDGRPAPSGWDHTPNTDRSAKSNDFPLSGQTLLNVQISASAGTPLNGQCFVMVQLIRGLGAAAIVVGTVLAGPVTATQSLGFPGSPIQSAAEGLGYLRAITGTTPAAGADISETVPTGARWQLMYCEYTVAADATGANRLSNFRIRIGGVNFFETTNGTVYTTAQTPSFFVAPNLPSSSDLTHLRISLAGPNDFTMLAGTVFGTTTAGMGPADQFSAPRYVVREWLDV